MPGAPCGFRDPIRDGAASTAGATLAFLLARIVLEVKAGRLTVRSPTFAWFNRPIERQGRRVVALVRLSPS
jgi:uncharacterized membrane protein YdjX (TVP38/TMEM64 family)